MTVNVKICLMKIGGDKTEQLLGSEPSPPGLSTPKRECPAVVQERPKQDDISQNPSVLRRCWRCREMLLESEFSRDTSRKSGFQSKCRTCSNAAVREWRQQKTLETSRRSQTLQTRESPRSGGRGQALNPDVIGKYSLRSLLDEGLTIRKRRHL